MSKWEQIWMENFKSCKEAVEQEGSYTLPNDLQTASGANMATWLSMNRISYKRGTLSEEKCRLLDSIHVFELRFVSREKLVWKDAPVIPKNAVEIPLSDEEYARLERLTEQEGCSSVGECIRRLVFPESA